MLCTEPTITMSLRKMMKKMKTLILRNSHSLLMWTKTTLQSRITQEATQQEMGVGGAQNEEAKDLTLQYRIRAASSIIQRSNRELPSPRIQL